MGVSLGSKRDSFDIHKNDISNLVYFAFCFPVSLTSYLELDAFRNLSSELDFQISKHDDHIENIHNGQVQTHTGISDWKLDYTCNRSVAHTHWFKIGRTRSKICPSSSTNG